MIVFQNNCCGKLKTFLNFNTSFCNCISMSSGKVNFFPSWICDVKTVLHVMWIYILERKSRHGNKFVDCKSIITIENRNSKNILKLTCPKCVPGPCAQEGIAASWKNILRAVCKEKKKNYCSQMLLERRNKLYYTFICRLNNYVIKTIFYLHL